MHQSSHDITGLTLENCNIQRFTLKREEHHDIQLGFKVRFTCVTLALHNMHNARLNRASRVFGIQWSVIFYYTNVSFTHILKSRGGDATKVNIVFLLCVVKSQTSALFFKLGRGPSGVAVCHAARA